MITITEKAAEWIKRAVENRPTTYGIRFGVRTTGCSGLAYVIEFVDVPDELSDEQFTIDDITVVIDRKSLPYLQGLEVDFAVEGLNSGLKFNNPNARGECGCGESFTV